MVFKNTKVMQGASIKRPFLKQIDFCTFVSNLIKKKNVWFSTSIIVHFFSHFLIAFLSLYQEVIMDGILLKYEGNISCNVINSQWINYAFANIFPPINLHWRWYLLLHEYVMSAMKTYKDWWLLYIVHTVLRVIFAPCNCRPSTLANRFAPYRPDTVVFKER